MKRVLLALMLAGSWHCSTAFAADEKSLDALVSGLVTWIGITTDYSVERVLADPPSIDFVSVGDVIQFEDGAILPVVALVGGVYDDFSRTIYLVVPWTFDETYDRSLLLHELVHAVQFDASPRRCLPGAEREAYELQARWLAERDIVLMLDWPLIDSLSSCASEADP